MSWGRVNHPSELFQVGDEVTVKVLKYNAETERVSLGLKQTQEDPWSHAEEAFPPGKKVHGKVMSITDYGAFVELEPGVEGPHPRQRDELDQEGQAPEQAPRGGPRARVPGPRGRRQAPSASRSASSSSSPIRGRIFTEKYHPGRQDLRQGPLPHRLRRVRRDRRGRRRHGPQERPRRGRPSVNNPSDLYPQGRRRRRHHPVDQPRREEGLPRRQAALGRPVADHLQRVPAGQAGDRQGHLDHRLRRVPAGTRGGRRAHSHRTRSSRA